MIKASVACLPFNEAFDLAKKINAEKDNRYFHSMKYFNSEEVLDWMEKSITPPYLPWRFVAAHSKLSWPRVEKWISSSRPMSLVAIGALETMGKDEPLCKLYDPADIGHMTEVLEKYLAIDAATSIKFTIPAIIKSWSKIIKKSIDETQKKGSKKFFGLDERFCHISQRIKEFLPANNHL